MGIDLYRFIPQWYKTMIIARSQHVVFQIHAFVGPEKSQFTLEQIEEYEIDKNVSTFYFLTI